MNHFIHKWEPWGEPFSAPSVYISDKRYMSVQERECTKCHLRERREIGSSVPPVQLEKP